VIAPEVVRLFDHCPFLAARIDVDDLDLPTVVFGSVGRLVMDRALPLDQELHVFAYFNNLAETGTDNDREILGTGAIELLNDNSGAQKLAREKLNGRALEMLEAYRRSWGQPDYGVRT
jgi:hypothetical protein